MSRKHTKPAGDDEDPAVEPTAKAKPVKGALDALPRYECHKKVRALKIGHVGEAPEGTAVEDGATALYPEESEYGPIVVNDEWVAKHAPEAGGYFLAYDDGYTSYSPPAAFQAGYTRI